MNIRRRTARIVGKEIANAGDTPQCNQVPPQVQDAANDHVPMNPPVMTDGEVRETLFQMAQAITSQDHDITA